MATTSNNPVNAGAVNESAERELAQKLAELRPVTFKLKDDAQGTVQYGLIAEEVDKIYPELVIRDQTGRIQGVRYEELTPMLLSEMQRQQQINAAQTEKIEAQAAEMRDLKRQVAELSDLKQEMHSALREMQRKGK